MLLNPYRFGVPFPTPPTPIVKSDLVSYWQLDEASGNAIDSHGTNHLTVVNGVGSDTGKIGTARDFEKDSTQYLTCASNASLQSTGIVTIAAWIKMETKGTTQMIVSKFSGVSGSLEYSLRYDAGSDRFWYDIVRDGVSGGRATANNFGSPPIGSWLFIVAWWDPVAAVTINIQVNNGTVDSSGMSGSSTPFNAAFRIGACDNATTPLPFDGLIDEVSLWKRVLTATERTSLYNSGFGHPYSLFAPVPPVSLTNLVSYWKLDEASGNAVDAHGTNTLTDNNTVTSAAGKINTARDFELSNSEWLSVASNASLQCGEIDFTLTAWVNFESFPATSIILAKDNIGASREYILYWNGSRIVTQVFTSLSGSSFRIATANSLGTPTAGVWYFIVVWHNAATDTVSIQINNGTIDSGTAGGSLVTGTAQFTIGAADSSANRLPFDGQIDEVGFWKRVLTSTERAQLYNSGNGLAYPFT